MDLNRRIRTLRIRRGLTGIELARRAGVSPSYISLIEHGEKVPSEAVAVRLAQVLGEREDVYRVWAATSRMDEQTREAVLRTRAEEPSLRLAMAGCNEITAPACFHPECPLDETALERISRPPGRPRKANGEGFEVSYRLDEDARSEVLRVPLVTPGIIPDENPPREEDIESLLGLDARLLGRTSSDNLVALRLNEDSAREVACWIGPQDVAVVDRRPRSFSPAHIHAFALPEGLRFYRACKAGGHLVLLPNPSSTAPPRPVRLLEDDATSFERLLFGTVIWSSRSWT